MQGLVDDRYRVVGFLGAGGMADVYLVHDDLLERDVALKVLRRPYADDEDFVKRFKREAQYAAALSHPHIVSFYGRGETEDGTHYIAMEYVPGGSLKARISQEGSLAPGAAATVTLQVAEALRFAHQQGLVHRDIKPHNVLLTEAGAAKVADFGIARACSAAAVTRTNFVLGTAQYISPEQATGEPASPRSDLYSLGVVLYEMLTGEVPYQAETSIGVAMKHVSGRLQPPRAINPNVPEGMNAITVRLLARNPVDRYTDASELIDDLAEVDEGLLTGVTATPTRVMDRVNVALAREVDGRTHRTRPLDPSRISPNHPADAKRDYLRKARKERRTRRSLARVSWIMAIILVAAVLGIGLGWTLRTNLQDHQTVAVPDISGMSVREATRSLSKAGLYATGTRRIQSPFPRGTVVSTNPTPGLEVALGTPVTLRVSAGPSKKQSGEREKRRKPKESIRIGPERIRIPDVGWPPPGKPWM
jgi:eukaryotic-like serine/threonine-protein kinase